MQRGGVAFFAGNNDLVEKYRARVSGIANAATDASEPDFEG